MYTLTETQFKAATKLVWEIGLADAKEIDLPHNPHSYYEKAVEQLWSENEEFILGQAKEAIDLVKS